MKSAPTAALIWLALSQCALAGSLASVSPKGHYALGNAACKAKDYFATLTETTLDLPTYSCTGVSYDQTESRGGHVNYHVTAKSCAGEETGQPRADAFALAIEGDALQILWRDGTKSAKLARCPVK
jgi:hypothetical protein